jgi:predicted dehydrogenase
VVCVCVPSGLHAEVGVRAAKAGKHLVVEKPLDVALEAADRLIAAAREAGVALTVMSQHRFDPGLVELKRLIDSGALGTPLIGEASTKWYRTQAYYDSARWRGTWAMDGGALLNQGVHYADLLLWCMGPATEVTAVCATQAHQIEVEDTALAIVRFASGAVGTLSATTAAYPGFAQRLEVTGADGHRHRRGRAGHPGRVAPRGSCPLPRCRAGGGRGGPGGAGRRQPRRPARRPARVTRRGARARGQRGERARDARADPRRVRLVAHRPPGRARPVTVTLSGFADEISDDLGEQLDVLAAESITHLELRVVGERR